MAKSRRRRPVAAAPALARRPLAAADRPVLANRQVAPAHEWHWRTFPVFFTLGATLFLTALLCEAISHSADLVLVVIPGALLLAGALAHLVSVYFVWPWLARSRRQ